MKIRTYHTLRMLSSGFDVTALCFYRRRQTAGGDPVPAVRALESLADVEAYPIPQEWSRLRWTRDHLTGLVNGRPYVDFVFRSRAFSGRLAELLEGGRFDVLHFESAALSRYIDVAPRLPTVCVHHNVESSLLRRRAEVAGNPVTASYLRLQAGRLRRLEAAVCPRFDLNVAVSREDAREFREIAPGADFVTIPNGVDTSSFRPSDGPTEGIVLLGGTDWFPNLDALEFFAAEILPAIRRDHPEVSVTAVGRASEAEIVRFRRDHRIELTGYVDDIRTYVHRARCVVVPLRVGGGSRLKILDSWALGKAVVSTSIGCEGLDVAPGRSLLVADDPGAFAAATCRLLEDATLAGHLGHEARQVAVESYSWDAIQPKMLEAYERLLSGGGARLSGS